MSRRLKLFAAVALILSVVVAAAWYLSGTNIAVLSPKGEIAAKERNLIVFTAALSLIVVVPVYFMTFYFAWKYREGNKAAEYRPDWDHSRLAETTWWAVPFVLILILSVVTFKSSHELDPFKTLHSDARPVTVQVVALDWKWLFIYPKQNIASVNFLQIPVNTPVNFQITSDAPMNSFWIPQLGGQIYAMSGMSTRLHLIADQTGDYRGSSANISGRGFASMHFTARASSAADFEEWVRLVKYSSSRLSLAEYDRLSSPSLDNPVTYYSSEEDGLYDSIVHKFMPYAKGHNHGVAEL